jgi:ERF superfamily
MGAALTYARRYALFTLVGIAGEDDLDAPDLNLKVEAVAKREAPAKGNAASPTAKAETAELEPEQAETAEAPVAKADALPSSRSLSNGRVQRTHGEARNGARVRLLLPTCGINESAAQRDRLIADMAQLQSSDEAADWVHKNMPVKNELTAADADLVATAFRERLAVIEAETSALENLPHPAAGSGATTLNEPFPDSGGATSPAPGEESADGSMAACDQPSGRSRRLVAKAVRLRDKEHCKYVATQACVICGRTPSEAHHIRFAQPRVLGRKVSDEYTVPVCRLHHRELHRYGDEASWWAGVSIDPMPIALLLWRKTHFAAQRDSPKADFDLGQGADLLETRVWDDRASGVIEV